MLTIRRAVSSDTRALAALVGGVRDHLGAQAPTDEQLQHLLPRALDDPGIEFSCPWIAGEAVGGGEW